MKTQNFVCLILMLITLGCQKKPSLGTEKKPLLHNISFLQKINKPLSSKSTPELPDIKVISSGLPVELKTVDLQNELHLKQISDGIRAGIENAIIDYYFNYCNSDSSTFDLYTYEQCYLGTIELKTSSNYTLYWVIFRHLLGSINSSVLFYDKEKKSFLPNNYYLNIHALYHEEDGKLEEGYLKSHFMISLPEIDLISFDQDSFTDFKLTRLYHNGTANAIEEVIIELVDEKIDTLSFERKWLN